MSDEEIRILGVRQGKYGGFETRLGYVAICQVPETGLWTAYWWPKRSRASRVTIVEASDFDRDASVSKNACVAEAERRLRGIERAAIRANTVPT